MQATVMEQLVGCFSLFINYIQWTLHEVEHMNSIPLGTCEKAKAMSTVSLKHEIKAWRPQENISQTR